MKSPKLLLALVIPLLIISCASRERRKAEAPEFNEGQQMGKEYAEKDIPDIDCEKTKLLIDATDKARTYTDMLKKQGRSEPFMNGFYMGYETTYYEEGIETKCGP